MKKKGKKKKKKKKAEPRLTIKMRRFAEYWVLLNGNGTQAARDAGYKGNDNVLAVTASRLLRNPKIADLIESLQEKERAVRVADIQERKETLTIILRNDKAYELDKPVMGCDVGTKEDGSLTFVRVAATDKDRIKAIDTLNKMEGVYINKTEVTLKHEDWLDALDGEDEE